MIDLSPTDAIDRIARLLAAPESRTLDFKRISGKQSRMYEAVCAFANSEGGLLVIGIGDAKAMKPGDKRYRQDRQPPCQKPRGQEAQHL